MGRKRTSTYFRRTLADGLRQHESIRKYWEMALEPYLHPMTLPVANEFVDQYHRHNEGTQGHKFSIGLSNAAGLQGVVIVGNPIGTNDDDGLTFEVRRLCTLGMSNACSMLYGAAWRAAKAMGYRRGITFTLEEEPGTSLRAAGWQFVGMTKPRDWNRPTQGRSRNATYEIQPRKRWEIGHLLSPA